jgi:trehalose-6-phosphate hydrolase
VDLGIQGFRFDVINLISKNKYDNDPNKDGKQYYTDGKKVTTYLKELLSFVPSTNKNIFTVGELSSTTPQKLAEYTQRNQNLLTCAFFFKHLYLDKSPNIKFDYHKPDFKLFFDHIKKWYLLVNNKNGCMASVLNNHDQPRSLSRFIQEPKFYKVGAKMLFGFMSSLDGIPFIYQGEEIGMLNPWFENIKDYRDTESITYIKSKKLTKPTIGLQHLSRDNARTPMQ